MAMENVDVTMIGYIDQLPEECLSHVISFTTPRDACILSAVSRAFRSAADSDVTWQRFLSPDYVTTLAQVVNPVEYASKKELYFQLCDHYVLVNGGLMSIGLDKSSGGKCFMISCRALSILFTDLLYCWRWITLPDSRFKECAMVIDVCWLEIYGDMESKMFARNTSYTVYLIFKLTPDAYGLNKPSLKSRIGVAWVIMSELYVVIYPDQDPVSTSNRSLPGGPTEDMINGARQPEPRRRHDGWLEVVLGNFYIGDGIDGKMAISLIDFNSHHKSGLIVEGIEIRPN